LVLALLALPVIRRSRPGRRCPHPRSRPGGTSAEG
jgi:hypothetical protein